MKKITLFLLFNAIVFTAFAQSPSLSFNGTDNVIDWGVSDGILRTSDNHTWEMWVKGPATTTGTILTEGWSGSSFRGQYRVNADGAGKLMIGFRNYAGNDLIARNTPSTTTVFDGTWHHIAIVGTTTAGETTTVLYVDGVADASVFGDAGSGDPSTYLRPTVWDNTDGGALNFTVIGQIARAGARTDNTADAGNTYGWYNGEVDEFRCWKRALLVAEIAANACTPASTTNLYRHVRFNEGSGTAFNDEVTSTTETFDGTTTGATYTTNASCVTASVADNVLSNAISVYPNPTNNVLSIKSNTDINIKNVSFYNVIGKMVYTRNGAAKSIDVSSLSKGLYFLKIESQEGGIATKKVLVN
jgi:hypothetical protein